MNLVACVDTSWGIGCVGELLFDIPLDKAHFRDLTWGKTIIMGANTWHSLPKKPLPNRTNVVLSKKYQQLDGAIVLHSLDNLLSKIQANEFGDPNDIFVIGGQQVYQQLLSQCNRAYITKVDAKKDADRFLVDLDSDKNWHKTQAESHTTQGYKLCFCVYDRTN